MKKVISTLVATAVLAMANSAMANDPRGYNGIAIQPVYAGQPSLAGLREINMRQEEQRARIEAGFHRGTITRWEFRRLMAEQQGIQAMERAFLADGFLGPRERMELHRRLDVASQHIAFEAHDGQHRF